MALMRRTTVYIDANGFTRAALLTTTLGAGSIQSAILGVSHADVSTYWEGPLVVSAHPSPSVGQFISVWDAAILTFATTGTSLLTVVVPAPKDTIFFSDLETVNPANIAALIAAVVGTAQTTSGDTATAFVSGARRRS